MFPLCFPPMVPSFFCSVTPVFLPFLLSGHLSSSFPSVLPSHHIEMGCCAILAFILSQNESQFIHPALFFTFLPSIPSLPPYTLPPSLLFLWSSSSSETTGEPLLKSTDRSTVKRNKGKDRFVLLKPQKLEGKNQRPVTAQEGITFWPLIVQREEERPWERAVQPGSYSTTSHVSLLFVYRFSSLSLSVLPPLWACPFLSTAGHRGWSQTNLK